MINDIKNDILPAMMGASPKGPRSSERGPKPEAEGPGGQKSFADQLLDAQSKRAEESGRDDTPRLRYRPKEREAPDDSTKLRARSDSRSKAKGEEKADDDDTDNLRSQTGAGSDGRMNLTRDKRAPEKASSEDKTSSVTESSRVQTGGVDRPRAEASKGLSNGQMKSQGAEGGGIGEARSETSAIGDGAETLEKLQAFGAEQTEVKQQAMAEFMARMQSEFGIEPEKILEAFGKMDAQSLMAPPEETMKQFLSSLELKAEQMPKAEALYQKMVDVTGEAELNEKLALEGAAAIQGVQLEILSPQERALKQLNEGLDQLNDVFFKKGSVSAEGMEAEIARLARMKNAKQGGDKKSEVMASSGLAAASLGLAAEASDSSSALDSSADVASSLSGPGENFSLPGSGANAMSANPNPSANSGFMNGQSQGQSGHGSEGSHGGQSSIRKELADALKAVDGGKGEAKKFAVGEGEALSGTTSSGATPFAPVHTGAVTQPVSATGPAAMMIDGPKATSQEEAENIKELIKQAQFLVKKGGGEMKLEMSPEGMGKVHLKVAVENGQVNVEMLTDSHVSKKMLEDGLHELKASLAAHKLHVDSMKIDVGSEIQKHMDQQAQQDASREQTRQFARDFMGQFRDERQGFWQGFVDNPGWKSYGRGPNRAPVEPESVVAAARSQGARAADGSKRLNLVA